MSLYDLFETDEKLIREGAPITFPANKDGTIPTFYCKRMSSSYQAYNAAIARIFEKYDDELKAAGDDVPQELDDKIMTEVLIDYALVGWENVRDRKGQSFEFSKQIAAALFNDLPELARVLRTRASALATYKVKKREEDAKN